MMMPRRKTGASALINRIVPTARRMHEETGKSIFSIQELAYELRTQHRELTPMLTLLRVPRIRRDNHRLTMYDFSSFIEQK